MSIVVLGTVALDTVKTPAGFKKDLLGGSAAHFAMSACLFTKVILGAVVGEDFPKKYLSFFRKKGLDLSCLQMEKGCTFRWQGEYKQDDLNTACTLNTELGVITSYVPRLSRARKKTKNVFLGNYDPDVQLQFLKQMDSLEFVGLDTMNLWIHNKRKSLKPLLKKTHILIINDTEARDLTYEKNLLQAARALNSYGPKMILIKKGENGALFYSKNIIFALPAFPIEKVVDPTGAGDTFAGGVMGYLVRAKRINDRVLKNALAYGTVLSSFNVQGFGLKRTAPLKKREVEKRIKEYKRFFRF